MYTNNIDADNCTVSALVWLERYYAPKEPLDIALWYEYMANHPEFIDEEYYNAPRDLSLW